MSVGKRRSSSLGLVLAALALVPNAGCTREGAAADVATNIPIACVPSALTKEQRARSKELRVALGALVERVEENRSGYTYRYRDDPCVFQHLAEWIPMERRCCPFLTFEVRWRAGEPQPMLGLSGPEGTKGFLKAEMPELPASPRT